MQHARASQEALFDVMALFLFGPWFRSCFGEDISHHWLMLSLRKALVRLCSPLTTLLKTETFTAVALEGFSQE
jgi:hypothetical protein